MGLQLYDTKTRTVRAFEPLEPGVVRIYVCGPTVQAEPHVGHARSAVAFDVLRRWLSASGYSVVYARNVTDIDDKILHNAGHAEVPWWMLAERNTQAFTAAYAALGCLPPTVEPRATGHVPEMIVLMRRLIDRGHAYAADGDVYFDVRSFPEYGALSGQRVDAMRASEDTGTKRDPLDFALWKGAKPGEPSWETPWGAGRPGWHLECSAMATKYLGPEFDIHGGGLDLLFPHHENETAQSCAAGDAFARYWLHNGMVNIGTEKMSKSLGNSLVVGDVLRSVRPQALRWFLAAAHYRSTLDWTEDGLAQAETSYAGIETFVRNAVDLLGEAPQTRAAEGGPVWDEFAEAMDEDLAVPRALSVVFGAVRDGNGLLAEGDKDGVGRVLAVVRRMLAVLGLDPVGQWPSARSDMTSVIDALVSATLAAREAARERRDFVEADRFRDALAAAGIVVEDTAAGPRWHLAPSAVSASRPHSS